MDWQLTKQSLGYWAIAPKDGPSIDPSQTIRVNSSDLSTAIKKAADLFEKSSNFNSGETLFDPDDNVIVMKP